MRPKRSASGGARRTLLGSSLLCLALLLIGAFSATAHGAEPPHINHMFVIVLENEDADDTFSALPPAPYLGNTMREEGIYLPNYYGIGHQSLDNYLALISGQPPNTATQADCQTFSDFTALGYQSNGVALGEGCVFPAAVQTIANQLEDGGHTWRSYNQGMAAGVAAGESTSCRHPTVGAADSTQKASESNQYAARHDPFVYFHSIIDYSTCERNVVDLTRLPEDLANLQTSPEYAFITPDLCSDGHDATCADPSRPGGFAGINAFLEEWVPRIKASAAYRDHGALMVTFDESESGAESCCGESTSPNTPNNGGTAPGTGGGRIGAVLESPCIKPGTTSESPYDHYSALRWMEDNWKLPHLAEASANSLEPFGTDVFDNPECNTGLTASGSGMGGRVGGGGAGGPGGRGTGPENSPVTHLRIRPRKVAAGEPHWFHLRLRSPSAYCRIGASITFAGHKLKTNRHGRTSLKATLSHVGKFVARARPASCEPSRTSVRAR